MSAFGVNAFSAHAGEQVIEEHDETARGAGGHEELCLVLAGRANFTVAGRAVDVPAGMLVLVGDPATRRSAVAAADGTMVMHYQLACSTALDGRADEAIAYLRLAFAGDPALVATAADDPDLASLRDRDDHPA